MTSFADFSGAWVLDTELSDPVDELLTMQGVGWMKRKMASAAQSLVTLTIQMDENVRCKSEASINGIPN
jgi:hypothetical protein